MNIDKLLSSTGKHAHDIVSIVKPEYPGVNRPLVSIVRNEKTYGVRFNQRAEKLIRAAFVVTAQEARTGDRHRLGCHLSCRVEPAKKEGVNTAFRALGYATEQDGMDALTDLFLEHPEILRKEQR